MSRTVRLKIEPMTKESFGPYGEIWDAREHPPDRRADFDMAFQPLGSATAKVMWQPHQTMTFTKLERHFHGTHIFIPTSGSMAAVAVAPITDESDPMAFPDPSEVRAFLIDGTKGFAYKRGVWHSLDRHILTPPGMTFVMFNDSPNPTQTVDYLEGYSLHHQDLTTDANPKRLEVEGASGITFEIVL